MKFGITVPGLFLYPVTSGAWEKNLTGDQIARIAGRADELGYDYLGMPDHIAMPNEEVEVMGPRYSEALVSIGFLAAVTPRIRLTNNILVLPYRHPLAVAKAASTLDFLSGGRFTLTVAVGHIAREFELLGVDYRRRGEMCDEYILAIKELWTSENPRFEGKYVRFHDVTLDPKPVQQPHPPIWIGGNARPALRRVAALADGWMPWLMTPERLREGLAYIAEQPGFEAKASTFEVFTETLEMQVDEATHEKTGATMFPSGKEETLDRLGRFRDAGLTGTWVLQRPAESLEEHLERMQWYAEEIFPVFR